MLNSVEALDSGKKVVVCKSLGGVKHKRSPMVSGMKPNISMAANLGTAALSPSAIAKSSSPSSRRKKKASDSWSQPPGEEEPDNINNDEDGSSSSSEASFFEDDPKNTASHSTRRSSIPQSSLPSVVSNADRFLRNEARRASTGNASEMTTTCHRRNWRPLLKSNLEGSVTEVSLVSKLARQWPPVSPGMAGRESMSGDLVAYDGVSQLSSASNHRPEPSKLDVDVRWPPIPKGDAFSRRSTMDDGSVLSEVKVKTRRETFELQEQQATFLSAIRDMDDKELRVSRSNRNRPINNLELPLTSKLEEAGKEVDDLFRDGNLVLPSGQKLPKGSALIYKKKRRRKKRRTNYRIRYDGPSLLDLSQIYGLPSVPEVDHRFGNSDARLERRPSSQSLTPSRLGESDSAPRMIRRQTSGGLGDTASVLEKANDQAPMPVLRRQSSGKILVNPEQDFSPKPVGRRISGDVDLGVEEDDADGKDASQIKSARRFSSGDLEEFESEGGNDVAPTYSRRRSSQEKEKGEKNCNDQTPTYSRRRSSSLGQTERSALGVSRSNSLDGDLDSEKDVAPAPPARRQSSQDDEPLCELDDVDDVDEATDESKATLNDDVTRTRPDVWITPIKNLDDDFKWKVKRVWYVESADADEQEHSCLNKDLVDTIRDLLGVPLDDRTELTNGSRPPWHLKIYMDIDGEVEESGSEISLKEEDFRMEVQRMSEIAEAEEDANTDDLEDEDKQEAAALPDPLSRAISLHSVRAYQRPNLWVSEDQQGSSESSERKWKVKRSFTVDMHGNVLDYSEKSDKNDNGKTAEGPEKRSSRQLIKPSNNDAVADSATSVKNDSSHETAVVPAKAKAKAKARQKEGEVKSGLVVVATDDAVAIVMSPRSSHKKEKQSPRPTGKKGVKKSLIKKSWNVIGGDEDDDATLPKPKRPIESVWLQKRS